jgi:copper resistance protein B
MPATHHREHERNTGLTRRHPPLRHLAPILTCLLPPLTVQAMGDADPLLFGLNINELETTGNVSDHAWDIEAWAGHDLHKLVLNSQGSESGNALDQHELNLLYQQALDSNWNLHVGWHGEVHHTGPDRHWLALGLNGVAPGNLATGISGYLDAHGHTALTLALDAEWPLSQRLHLAPSVELNLYGKDDSATATGAGVSELAAGLRLRYRLVPHFSPYIGINRAQLYGNTADYARADGESTRETQLLLGIHAWF